VRKLGQRAEDLALAFLESRGLRLLARNYHFRLGEIDLVMRDGETLVFVEVRLRHTCGHGSAAESVTRNKQDKLIQGALHFLGARSELDELDVRFDVLAMSELQVDESCWIKNAFDASM
jgi:putative endonuclease